MDNMKREHEAKMEEIKKQEEEKNAELEKLREESKALEDQKNNMEAQLAEMNNRYANDVRLLTDLGQCKRY